MANDPRKHRDRCNVTGNVEAEYVDADETVLINKRGVTDLRQLQLLEEEGLVNAYEALLEEMRTDTPITSELIRYIHRQIFGELYEWAGRWRTVNISKPGITWPPPAYLDENMTGFEREVLAKFSRVGAGPRPSVLRLGGPDSRRVSRHSPVPRGKRSNHQAGDRFISGAERQTATAIRPNRCRAKPIYRRRRAGIQTELRTDGRDHAAGFG